VVEYKMAAKERRSSRGERRRERKAARTSYFISPRVQIKL
jgi:hypothetical protein